jgi:putative ABC transport system permease protein
MAIPYHACRLRSPRHPEAHVSRFPADLRFGFRMILKNPSLAAIAVTAFALGIGLTTVTFSIVYGALLRGLPVPEPERLIHLEESRPEHGIESQPVSIPDFADWRAQQTAFEDLSGFAVGTANLAVAGEKPERYSAAYTTASMFDLVRVRPHIGRALGPADDAPGSPQVVLLSDDLWRNRFGADPGVLGRTIRLNGEPTTIVGVMPPRFRFPILQDLWVNLRPDPTAVPRGEGRRLEVFGRLKPGASLEGAGANLAAVTRRLGDTWPATNAGIVPLLKPYTEEFMGDEVSAMLYTMLAGVFGVLLIACANVANLLLARTALRGREVAIRTALGASRARLVSQLLSETAVMAAGGAVLGLVIAAVGIRMFNNAMVDARPPFWIDIRLHPPVLLFSLGLTLAASLAAGLVPALQASGSRMYDVLKDESRAGAGFRLGRFSRGLVLAEIALSCALLVAAGLMTKSVVKLRHVDFGFRSSQVFTAEIALFESAEPDTAARVVFLEELLPRLAAIPGVGAAAIASTIPGEDGNFNYVAIEGRAYAAEADYPEMRYSAVSPRFFDIFNARPTQGRVIEASDRLGTLPVAVVNASFARTHFPDESPVGRRIRFGRGDSKEPWRTVVGVVPDRHMDGVENEEPEGVYVPLSQRPHELLSLVATAEGNPMRLTGQVAAAVAQLDPDLPVFNILSHAELVSRRTWYYRVFGTLFMVAGLVALFLAAIGLYGVMAFSVTRRRHEFGVRMALGANAQAILRLVLGQGLRQLALGIALGLGGGLLLARGLQLVLFGVNPSDAQVYAGIVAVLGLTGLLACLVPARRATRIEPLTALRSE